MADWQSRRLADVLELRRGFDLPARLRKDGPYPVLSAGLTAGWHSEGPVKGPGFVVGRATNLGKPTWSDTDYWPLNTTLYAADFKGNDPRFLYHLFEVLDLTGFDSGSVQPMLNRNYIASIEVHVPDIRTQQAIANVLRALDDKIAANRTAVGAAEDLSTALASRSSGRVPLHSIARQSKDQLRPEAFDGTVAHFSLPAFDAGTTPVIEAAKGIKSNKFVITEPAVLISKLNPRIPRLWDVPVVPDRMALASTEYVVLAPAAVSSTVLWALLRHPSVTSELAGEVAGTSGSHQRVRPSDILTLHVGDPSTLNTETQELITGLGRLIHSMRAGSIRLAAARDELLPLLMSGRLRVRELEKVVEAVV